MEVAATVTLAAAGMAAGASKTAWSESAVTKRPHPGEQSFPD
jgi:hypothetical protein